MKLKPIEWIGSSKSDLLDFPDEVRKNAGYALYFAQQNEMHNHAKPLKGFGGANVIEIIEQDSSGTYRVVYTVKMPKIIFVLHAFQKKSKQGIATPKQDIDLIKQRLKQAQEMYKTLKFS